MSNPVEAAINDVREGHEIYASDYTHAEVPFLTAPSPLEITQDELQKIQDIGAAMEMYFRVVGHLYHNNQAANELLNRGKPEIFQNNYDDAYLFIRPDLVRTKDGFKICEVETSPFGLALSHILTRAHEELGQETAIESGVIVDHVVTSTPATGEIAHGDYTGKFAGQLGYLATKLFGGDRRKWSVTKIEDTDPETATYRGFYLHETLSDENVRTLLEGSGVFLPSLTPHAEEKAVLALIWDTRFARTFRDSLGKPNFDYLRRIIPKTWILGEEEFFEPGLPNQAPDSVAVAALPKSKRQHILKPSGFNPDSSWGKGVVELGKRSGVQAQKLVQEALDESIDRLFVVQEFAEPLKQRLPFFDGSEAGMMEDAKVRITPYFSAVESTAGRLLTAKATARSKTNLIHAASDSINMPIAAR